MLRPKGKLNWKKTDVILQCLRHVFTLQNTLFNPLLLVYDLSSWSLLPRTHRGLHVSNVRNVVIVFRSDASHQSPALCSDLCVNKQPSFDWLSTATMKHVLFAPHWRWCHCSAAFVRCRPAGNGLSGAVCECLWDSLSLSPTLSLRPYCGVRLRWGSSVKLLMGLACGLVVRCQISVLF